MDGLRLVAEPSAAGAALLGVDCSILGRHWIEAENDPLIGLAVAQRLQIPEILGRVLAARGVLPDSAGRFLTPTLRDWLPDPCSVKDMDAATERLVEAIERGRRIAVFGDYDVDGAASSALLHRYLTLLDVPVEIYIPDRMTEGYGPNATALAGLQSRGAAVAICVDCGTLAFEALASAAAGGLDIVVLDHHAAEPRLPAAVAVVNPNRLDDTSGLHEICAATVVFLLLVSLNRTLRSRGYFYTGRPEPDLIGLLDLVALATVCDVMPLTGLNRAIVAQGLRIMAQRRHPGLAALADNAKLSARIDASHLGFFLGPRINAGGRVGKSDIGSRLLATDDPIEAQGLAAALEALNAERREIEAAQAAEAIAMIDAAIDPAATVTVAHGTDWHPGVIGIVAARLKERYDRPACVIAWGSDGTGKGSGRSLPGIDLGAAIIAARQAGLLIGGGGHAMAAGFTIARERIEAFTEFLTTRIAAIGVPHPARTLRLDGVIHPTGCTPELLGVLEALGPYGTGNPEPRFALAHARIIAPEIVGQHHVRCQIGAGGSNLRLKAIAFRAAETPLGTALINTGDLPLHLAGHLKLDRWQGRETVQFQIIDAAQVAPTRQ